jgi:iron complex transport system substrate-binding protein
VVATYSTISSERIVGLHPDVVVGIPAQAPIVGDLTRAGLHPRLLPDDSFDDIFTNLATLGELSGHRTEASALARRLRARTAQIVGAVGRATRGHRPPTVFVVLSTAPIFTVGPSSYIATLIHLAGGVDAAHDLTTAYARYGDESLLALQPDVIVTDRSVALAAVLDRAPWNALRAVREKRVYVLDNPDLLQRPGPRYNEGLAWLATHLHPNVSLR